MNNIENQIEKIKRETGFTLSMKNGRPYYNGFLDLRGTAITTLPENLTVRGFLDLRGTAITSLPDNLMVGGDLYLENTAITSLPDNLTVGGYLDLRGTAITSLPENLTVGGSLDLENTAITSLPDNLMVGGDLYLENTAITSLPDNLTVGGYLDLRGTAITSLPENLTVGGSLYLRGTGITSLPDNLTVGRYFDLEGTGITDKGNIRTQLTAEQNAKIEKQQNPLLRWEWNRKTYIKVDGIFSEVISNKGNLYHIKQIGSEKIEYLITDGNGKWAHGKTLQEAKADLLYKISNRDKSSYEDLTLESELSFEDAVVCYRVITGACSAGTRDYLENRLPKPHKPKYTIAEIIKLTENEYQGRAFADFFKHK